VVHTIGVQILSGSLRPGDPLPPEDDLTSNLAVSRTVLREAVKVLAAKGLVESRPKTGTRVRPRNAWNLLDPDVLAWQQDGAPPAAFLRKLTEVRLIIEPAAASLAAERAGAAELKTIEEAFRGMEAALNGDTEDYAAFDRADMRFHQAIVRACGNDLLEQMGHVVYSALLLSFQATSRLPGQAKASLSSHRAILDAIRRRSVRRAGRAMHHLVQTTADAIETLPRRRRA